MQLPVGGAMVWWVRFCFCFCFFFLFVARLGLGCSWYCSLKSFVAFSLSSRARMASSLWMVSIGVLVLVVLWWTGFSCWIGLGTVASVDNVNVGVHTLVGVALSTLGSGLLAMTAVSQWSCLTCCSFCAIDTGVLILSTLWLTALLWWLFRHLGWDKAPDNEWGTVWWSWWSGGSMWNSLAAIICLRVVPDTR